MPENDKGRKAPENTTGPSRNVDTPYTAGHTPSRGIPDEDQNILDNVREQKEKPEKEEPAPSVWHGDPEVPEGEKEK